MRVCSVLTKRYSIIEWQGMGDHFFVNASTHFDSYRIIPHFASRLPDLSRQEFDDETTDLCHDTQVTSVQVAPESAVHYSAADLEAADETDESWLTNDKANLYLWLVLTDDVKICLENGVLGQSTERGRLSHTNLSGNAPAHCGGELWFRDAEALSLSTEVLVASQHGTPLNWPLSLTVFVQLDIKSVVLDGMMN